MNQDTRDETDHEKRDETSHQLIFRSSPREGDDEKHIFAKMILYGFIKPSRMQNLR